jgi:rhodanese-related sulfurtransferase
MRVKLFLKLLPLLLFSSVTKADIQQITPQLLLTLLQKQQAPLILDVRSQQEYQHGHIEGAVNISYDQLETQSALLNDYKQQPIIVYCRSGRRAQVAYQILQQQGFSQLVDLQGHMNLWQQKQYPLAH